ncbi:MAG: aldo/keto reductase [Akkermansiaceae bacterium]|jgi:L-galactose dehydrogenase|nr:aldo/keto reductase [Akkermansiaceae bacterium]MDP4721371.1 aldo/keto reductase [Akkermansiaceae bacterium]MDP4779408.1 aldo/keto reductase [Akkermansiaceae bacterium]MDP4846748.1 aldo/keto reductase [Akkermansiaceae bacterium]MDP4897085.1 aldo/keto reductase [Akkermansiaceae bacterium]
MDYRPLGNTGLTVSALSFGASSLGAVFRPVSVDQCIETVHAALDGGINLIDVSPSYGETLAELNLGRALEGIQRDRYILATKIGSYSEERGDYDFSRASTERSVEHSLKRLGVDCIDLIQCHDIEFADHDQIVNETLPTLHRLKEQGLVRHVGITGLPLNVFPSIIDRVAPGIVETILSFCHYELNDTSLEDLIPYFKEHGVGIINASPTGMGLLTSRGAPDWHPSSKAIQEGCSKAVQHCESRGVDIVKLAVQFCCANPDIATTLVGTANPKNIRDNIDYANEPLDETLLAEVLEILEPIHNHNFTRGLPEHHDPLLA